MRRLHRAQSVRDMNNNGIDDELEGFELPEGPEQMSDEDRTAAIAKIEQDRIDALRALGVWDDQ